MTTFLLQLLVAGLAIGTIYGLVALGVVLLVNSVQIINFAQGEFVMLGSFLVFTVGNTWGVPFWGAFPIVVVMGGLIGVLFQHAAHRFIPRGDIGTYLVSTLAAAVVIRNVAQHIWGALPVPYDEPFGTRMLNFGPVLIVPQHLLIFGFTAVLMVGLWIFFFQTRLGRLMRAASQDKAAARLIGVNVSLVTAMTFMMASATGSLAGVLLAPINFADVNMGFMLGLKAFVATIIGGWGSVPGALAGGIVTGLVEVLATAFISSLYKDVYAFGMLFVFLIARPQGIFGEKIAEKA